MKIISFAWTTGALLAGAKTTTRREWSRGYADRWGHQWVVAWALGQSKEGGVQR